MSAVRFLVAEADPAFAENLVEMLDLAGYPSDVARSAAEARDLASARAYEVALVDLGLPDARGADLVSDVKRHAPHLLAVVLTSQPTLSSARDAMRAGATAYVLKDGDPRELEATIRRTAQQASLARALRESEARYALVVERAPLGIALVQDGRYVLVNERYAAIFGFPDPRELEGRPVEDVYDEDERPLVRERWRLDGEPWQETYAVSGARRHDGNAVDLLVTRARLELEGRLAVQVLVRDVSEENRLARELDAARSQVEEKRRLAALGEMVAGIAHEVRNPLQAVAWGLKELRDLGIGGKEGEREAIAKIERGIRETNGIVAQVLDYARPMKADRIPFAVDDVLEGTREDVAALAEQAGVRLDVARADGAPREVSIDAPKVKQALVNLVRNAIEASPRGGTVKLSVARGPGGGGAVAFEVEDEGNGIPPQLGEKVLLPFVTTKVKGTGLGLAIVRRIVEAHGGTMRLEPRKPRGTRARIELPPS